MNLEKLCRNCMLGTIESGVCSKCGKPAGAEQSRPAYALPSGMVLCRQYFLGRVLGSGGFGITYLAWDMKNRRRVAIKELFPNMDMTRTAHSASVQVVSGQEGYVEHIRQRFLEEAQALYAFSEVPDIMDVYHLFRENGTAYYAMEYLEGTDLKTFLKKNGRMTWEQISVYVRMILSALCALHARNLIHRDISPDNIFLTVQGKAKLIDFGSLRCYNNGMGLTTILKQNFAPYEQYQSNGKQGPWTDIYALCVTIYYALSGVLPPKAPERILEDSTAPLRQLAPGTPEHVSRAVTKGMAVSAGERFQSAGALFAALFPGEEFPRTGVQAEAGMRPRAGAGAQAGAGMRPGTGAQAATGVRSRRIICISGSYTGRSWELAAGCACLTGRDARCQIPYPPRMPGISRQQCTFLLHVNGNAYVRDEHSAYGTFVNGQRIRPGMWYLLGADSVVGFAQERFQIR